MAIGACVFCDSPVRSQGEHVLPNWFLKRWNGHGPFTIKINDKPVAERSGNAHREQLARVMLPVCGSNSLSDCNKWLNDTFENPARQHVRAALDELRPVTGQGVTALARWAAKTLLLHHHPAAVNSQIGHLGSRRDALVLPDTLLPTLRKTGQFPEDLSLWMGVVDPNAAPVDLPRFDMIALPQIDRPDGAGGTSCSAMLGWSLPNGMQAVFHLMLHPLFDIENPFETAGWATRLWPVPPASLDITTHPALDAAGGKQLGSSNLVGVRLPPTPPSGCTA